MFLSKKNKSKTKINKIINTNINNNNNSNNNNNNINNEYLNIFTDYFQKKQCLNNIQFIFDREFVLKLLLKYNSHEGISTNELNSL